MKIIMDDREPKGIELMADVVGGMKFERKRLKEGDYICDECPDVVIERKTIDDFCCSIIDDRLKSQREKMARFPKKYILVSGKIKDRTSAIHEHSILGMVVSLMIKDGIFVVFLDDDFQLLYVMKRIFERCVMEDG